MNEDRRRIDQYASDRDAALRSWLSSTVYPYSPVLRTALDDAGLGQTGVRSADDLGWLQTTPLPHLGDGRAYVLEPTAESIGVHGPLVDRIRLRVADAFGRRPELARERVDPEHRPVLWTMARHAGGILFVASTTPDLDRIERLGRRALSASGVRRDDRLLVLDPAGGRIGPWQLLAGARSAGVAVLHADEPSRLVVQTAEPTVVAGRVSSLRAAIDEGLPDSVRTLIVHDGPAPSDEDQGVLDATGLPVAEWWQPPSTRASWVRCPGGDGFHTWPTDELVEVLDPHGRAADRGELVWSPVGWHGSVWLRVRTGIAVAVDTSPCDACGRTTPRVRRLPASPASAPATRRRRGAPPPGPPRPRRGARRAAPGLHRPVHRRPGATTVPRCRHPRCRCVP